MRLSLRKTLLPAGLLLALGACSSSAEPTPSSQGNEAAPVGAPGEDNPGDSPVPGAGGAAPAGSSPTGTAGGGGGVLPPVPGEISGPGSGRRLTKTEYLYTVQDVLGVESEQLSNVVVADSGGEGFRNAFAALLPSGKRTNAFSDAATIAAEAMSAETISGFSGGCSDFGAACTESYVNNVGRMLFRRPVQPRETMLFGGLFKLVADNDDSFDFGARFVVEAMLQSPSFLYRVERADRVVDNQLRIDGYELATRLSYLLWQSAPDSALLDAVAAGGLEPQNVEATVRDMIASPKFRRTVRTFASEWLQLYTLEKRSRDEGIYPEFNDALVADMREETLGLFERLALDQKAPLMSAYTDQRTTVSAELASVYGLPAGGEHDLTSDARRSGFLTHAAVLTAHSIADSTSIVDRGLFVLGKLLCRPIPTPPEELLDEINAAKENVDQTKGQRDILEQHRNDAKCEGCHSLFDPLGYAFEAYDGIGRFQTVDPRDNPIATDGEASVDGVPQAYANATEFAQIMVESTWAKECVVKQVTEFAYGRVLGGAADKSMVDDLVAKFDASDQDFSELFLQVALTPALQQYVPKDQSLPDLALEPEETP